MERQLRRKAVPGTPSRSRSPAIALIPQPASERSYTSRESLLSRRSSHEETDQRESHARNSFVSLRSSDDETVQAVKHPRKSHPDYNSLPGEPPPDPELPSWSPRPARRSSLDATPPAKNATRMLDKIGWWPATLVILCLILLAASVAFLSWIWFAGRGNTRWRNIMLGPYSTVAVTITTFVVRLAVAGITWMTVAMMVSVVVERHGVPEEKMAEASMARYTGSIVSLALDGFTLKTSWFRILVPLQVLCAVLSQLSSTFLFSDFGNALLPGFPVETSVKYDFNGSFNQGSYYMNPLRVFSEEWQHFQPGTFEPFAEHSRPEDKVVGGAVDDTGPVWRALLPLGAYDNKTNIHEYNGVARVVDSRTICVRPDIQTFGLYAMNSTLGMKTMWTGKARIDASSVPDVLHDGGGGVFEEEFICNFNDITIVTSSPIWFQCGIYSKTHHRIPTLDPLFYNRSAIDTLQAEFAEDTDWMPDDNSPKDRISRTRTGQTQILLEASLEKENWYTQTIQDAVHGSTDVMLNMSIANSVGEGPWKTFEVEVASAPTPQRPIPIRATYCWDVMSHGNAPVPYLNITATSEAVMSPPVTSWNESAARYLTKDVRTQLGATTNPPPLQKRAVFTLTEDSLERAIDREVRPADVASYVTGADAESNDNDAYRTYLAKTSLVSFDPYVGTDTQAFWTNLLTDVLEDTGSPALAVQAINTGASRMIYTNWIGSFTAAAQPQITHLTEFRVPVTAAGYIAVMSVVAAQIALLVVVGVMFGACANSVLNDAWLVVSQVSSSPGAVGALVREKGVADADVRRFVGEGKGRGLRRRVVVRDGAFREPDEA